MKHWKTIFSADAINGREVDIFTTLLPRDHPGVAEKLPHSGLEANHLFNGVTNTSFPSLPAALLKHKLKDIVGAGNLEVFEPAKNSTEAIELQIGRPRSWAYGGNHSQRVRPRPVVTPVDRLVELQISKIPIPIQRTRWNGESDCLRLSQDAVTHTFAWLARDKRLTPKKPSEELTA